MVLLQRTGVAPLPQAQSQVPQPAAIVYTASPSYVAGGTPYFTAASGGPSGYAAVPSESLGSQTQVLFPLVLSTTPSAGVQYATLASPPGTY